MEREERSLVPRYSNLAIEENGGGGDGQGGESAPITSIDIGSVASPASCLLASGSLRRKVGNEA